MAQGNGVGSKNTQERQPLWREEGHRSSLPIVGVRNFLSTLGSGASFLRDVPPTARPRRASFILEESKSYRRRRRPEFHGGPGRTSGTAAAGGTMREHGRASAD